MTTDFWKKHQDIILNAIAILIAAAIAAVLAPPFLKRASNGEVTGWGELFSKLRDVPMDSRLAIEIVVFGVMVIGVFSIYTWVKRGGFYYWRHPVAKVYDEMNKAGQLKNVDTEAALRSVDVHADKRSQVEQFKNEVTKQRQPT